MELLTFILLGFVIVLMFSLLQQPPSMPMFPYGFKTKPDPSTPGALNYNGFRIIQFDGRLYGMNLKGFTKGKLYWFDDINNLWHLASLPYEYDVNKMLIDAEKVFQ